MTGHSVAGRSIANVDGPDKVTGRARYVVDESWPGVCHGAVVRSSRAHATITGIDAGAALAQPGVRAVVDHGQFDGIFAFFGHHRADHPVLAPGVVRYYGEPVAVVVADSEESALLAARLVEIGYDDLPELMDVDAALQPDAPLIHPDRPREGEPFGTQCVSGPAGTNIGFESSLAWGDLDEQFAHAARVVRTRVRYPKLFAYPMEPYCAQARFVDGSLEVESNAQHPFQVQRDLARMFDLGLHRVRVRSGLIGGGYGAKSYSKLEPLAAACAKVTGLAVRIRVDVEESMYTTRADGADVDITSAFAADGTILARDVNIVLDTGAYADNSPRVLRKCVECCFGPYRLPALRVRASAVFTNTTPASSYRGFGAYHTNAAGESNIDRGAALLGLGALDIRLRNLLAPGERPLPGARPLDADLAADLRLVHSSLKIEPRRDRLQGIGLGCALSPEGADPTSVAIVRLLVDGTAVVLVGSTEMGQGARTVLAQIVAEELGLGVSDVTLVRPDTAAVPYQWTTGASRTTAVVGLSVRRACADVHDQVAALATALDASGSMWSWCGNGVVDSAGRHRAAADVIAEWFGDGRGELVGTGRTQRRGDLDQWPVLWEVGVVGVAVDIDPSTGELTVDQLVTVADVGFAINPLNVRGQDLGAATQALGGALHEELVYDGPQLVNSNLIDYRVPRVRDVARRIETHIVERGDGPGPYGAKPVGEGAMTAIGGAIISAVADATGRWAEQLPLTPERLWRLLGEPADETPRQGRSCDAGDVSAVVATDHTSAMR